jgi:large subunit ribosomal protein L3
MPGKLAPGQFGNVNTTVQNLKVALVDADRNLIAVRGAIPGARGALVVVSESVKQLRRAKKAK